MKRNQENIFRAYRNEFVHDDCALLLLHHCTDGTPATIFDWADCRCSSARSDREAFREEVAVDVVLRVAITNHQHQHHQDTYTLYGIETGGGRVGVG
jgi:hypothetical protein